MAEIRLNKDTYITIKKIIVFSSFFLLFLGFLMDFHWVKMTHLGQFDPRELIPVKSLCRYSTGHRFVSIFIVLRRLQSVCLFCLFVEMEGIEA